MLYQYREVVTDRAGNALPVREIQVTNADGSPATIYTDAAGLALIAGNVVFTDESGRALFYAASGRYRVVATDAGGEQAHEVVIGPVPIVPIDADDVATASAEVLADVDAIYRVRTPPYTRYVSDGNRLIPLMLGTYTISPIDEGAVGNGIADDTGPFLRALDRAKALVADGAQNVLFDLRGYTYGLASTLIVNDACQRILFSGGALAPVGDDATWAETDAAVIAYFDANQTVTFDGKTWVLRKPLVKVTGSNPGVQFDNVNLLCARKSAGVYAQGAAPNRFWRDSRIELARSYSVYTTGNFGLEGRMQIIPDTTGIGPRDAYGLVYDGLDAHWSGFTSQWSHCPLLTTGATLYMTDGDLFNGSNSPTPAVNPRLWEHRGNTITWIGGRLGNGKLHLWSTDLAIFPTKIGLTSASTVDFYIRFIATTANKTLSDFVLYMPELPFALRGGGTKWFEFTTEGSGSWGLDTASLGNVDSYVQVLPGAMRIIGGRNNASVLDLEAPSLAGCRIGFRDGNNVAKAFVGSQGADLVLGASNVEYWRVVSNGVLRPDSDNTRNVGSPANRIAITYTTVLEADTWRLNGSGTTVKPEIKVSGNGLFVAVNGANAWEFVSNGVLRPATDGTQNIGSAALRIDQLYAVNGTINTSDARAKTPVLGLSEREIAAATRMAGEIGTYQWLASIAAKGDEARQHVGMTVQRAIEVLQFFGLDPYRYGFICRDVEGGVERLSFRTDQLLLFIARGFEERLARLEKRL